MDTAADHDFGIDRPVQAKCPGAEVFAVVVVRVAIRCVENQFFRVLLSLDQGDVGFGEKLSHVKIAAGGLGRTALAGTLARAVILVRVQVQAFLSKCTAERHVDAGDGQGRPDSVGGEVSGELGGCHELIGRALGVQGHGEVVDHLRGYGTFLEDVPRHAVGVSHGPAGIGKGGPTHDFAVMRDRVKGAKDPGHGQIVQVGVPHFHFRVLDERVVIPEIVEISAHSQDSAVTGVGQFIPSRPALHVSAADVDHLSSVGDHVVVFIEAGNRVALLLRQERVIASQGAGVEETPGRCDLRGRPVALIHEFGIGFRLVVESVVGECPERIALVGALEVVRRAVVVSPAVPLLEVVFLDDVVERRPADERAR